MRAPLPFNLFVEFVNNPNNCFMLLGRNAIDHNCFTLGSPIDANTNESYVAPEKFFVLCNLRPHLNSDRSYRCMFFMGQYRVNGEYGTLVKLCNITT